ncbi:hypothetical protein [Thermoflexus sp.]|jgi:hypothetical protein|uniref:hypothetical protein n=1 Tax=Thermoflexus sp. TaxID=1969742 RepID=UPI003C0FAF53
MWKAIEQMKVCMQEILGGPVLLALKNPTKGDFEKAICGNGWPVTDPRLEDPCLQPQGVEAGVERMVLRATLSMGIAGFPRKSRWFCPVALDLARREERWVVVGWEWEEIPPWIHMKGNTWASDRFTVVLPERMAPTERSLGRMAGRIASWLNEALESLAERLPPEIQRPRYLAVWVPQAWLYAEMAGARPTSPAATVFALRHIREGGEIVGCASSEPIIFLNRQLILRRSRRGRVEVARHELVHASLARWNVPWRPIWLSEGVAALYAGERLWRELAGKDALAIRSLAKHAMKAVFVDPFTPRQALLEMAACSALAEFARERYGEGRLLSLYKAFSAVPAEVVRRHAGDRFTWARAEQIVRETAPALLQRHLGVREEEFLDAFVNWVLSRLSGARRKRPAGR